MSSEQEQDSKTEAPSPRRIEQARERGEVAVSRDVMALAAMAAAGLSFVIVGAYSVEQLDELWRLVGERIAHPNGARLDFELFSNVMYIFVKILAVPFGLIAGVILLAGLAQTQLNFSVKPLAPKFDKMNPGPGLKRMFMSARTVVDLSKSIGKLAVLSAIAWWSLEAEVFWLQRMPHLGLEDSLGIAGGIFLRLLFAVGIALLLFAALDFAWQQYEHTKQMRMTKQEVKDDFKQQEGDPMLKGARRQRQREMAQARGTVSAAAEATVIVVNPTHIAVALRYEPGHDGAPVVLCMGKDKVAERIRTIARENGVPIIQRRSLARLLFKTAAAGQAIPMDVYEAVAEVLALVIKMRRGRDSSRAR